MLEGVPEGRGRVFLSVFSQHILHPIESVIDICIEL